MTDEEKVQQDREHLRRWIETERRTYADVAKYGEGMPGRRMLVEAMRSEGIDGKWSDFIDNYYRRVHLFGVNTPQGRQAMGKMIVTLMHCLETAIAAYGPMPAPGVSSGEILPYEERESVE